MYAPDEARLGVLFSPLESLTKSSILTDCVLRLNLAEVAYQALHLVAILMK
ncbi:hypothetical protein M7I_1410 [Glarea lozoyensis 74030]|uniref:Uncharacterized protein n=1 Tax=Glarea lozoyensis (strain ATCC 74030 / MF5533) TaxID=1104152 RepID=H0EG02_GLAL7|nr:hypothetical protein M7I_1410 [Glarea lozoyensis 74030]